jgi:hypothetical protein
MLVAFALLLTSVTARADQPKAGVVVLENETGVPVRIDGGYYIDVDGKRKDLTGYWMLAPGQRSKLVYSPGKDVPAKEIVAQEFFFHITTADGQSRGWTAKVINADAELRSQLNAKSLAEHRDLVAANRQNEAAGVGTLQVQVPEGGVVAIGTWKAPVAAGTTLINTPKELKPGHAEVYTVRVEYESGGKSYKEEGVFFLEPGAPVEWDCRDIVAPDKMARTARYVFACRDISRREYAKIGKDPTPEVEAKAMEAIGKRTDAMPIRGVDEDAVKHNLTMAEAYQKLAADIKTGKAGRTEMDAVLSELTTKASRTRKLLEARYGDPYQLALENGGKLATTVTTLKLPVVAPKDDKTDRRTKLDADIASTAWAVSKGEQELTELNNKIIVAKVALLAAKAAYEKAEPGSGKEFVAGLAVAAAQRVLDELNADKNRVESDLKANRDRLNRRKSEKSSLGD